MFTTPEIVISEDASQSGYVKFYFNGERFRIRHGKLLNLPIFPNKQKDLNDKLRLFRKLKYELTKHLEKGWDPNKPISPVEPVVAVIISAKESLDSALSKKLASNLSDTYQRDLIYIHAKFLAFLTDQELTEPIQNIRTVRVEEFLQQFNSSNTYYMNKRTDLAALFSTAGKAQDLDLRTITKTQRRRTEATLHIPYTNEQIKPLLSYIESKHPSLYLCCLLTYGCWLRPHVEVRGLLKKHFSDDYSAISLSGRENKGKRVRVVFVPDYAREVLKPILDQLTAKQNIFSRTEQPLNKDYFKTAWNRLRPGMLELGLIQENQTHYSFRHTAAVNEYTRTKNIYRVQDLLGHTSIAVTQKYLRSLGNVDLSDLEQSAPQL
jgi:integrase